MSQRTARGAAGAAALVTQVAACGQRAPALQRDCVVAFGLPAEGRAHQPRRRPDLDTHAQVSRGWQLEVRVLAVEPTGRLHALAGDLDRGALVEIAAVALVAEALGGVRLSRALPA